MDWAVCRIAGSLVSQGRSMATHGRRHSPEYCSWYCMKQRCLNPRNERFSDYGGAGITVCDRWLSFENFFADMGSRPAGTSLDRKDGKGPYEPENCRWATPKQQVRNRRDNARATAFGETKLVVEWSEDARCVVSYGCLRKRFRLGWLFEEALSKKSRKSQ